MGTPSSEKRHQQRHGAGGPLRLPTPLPKTRGGVPPELRGVGDAPKIRRHGDAGLHGAPRQGRNGPELRVHEQGTLSVRMRNGIRFARRLQIGDDGTG